MKEESRPIEDEEEEKEAPGVDSLCLPKHREAQVGLSCNSKPTIFRTLLVKNEPKSDFVGFRRNTRPRPKETGAFFVRWPSKPTGNIFPQHQKERGKEVMR